MDNWREKSIGHILIGEELVPVYSLDVVEEALTSQKTSLCEKIENYLSGHCGKEDCDQAHCLTRSVKNAIKKEILSLI